MTKNVVSILITNYNKSLFLKKTIRSCLNQNYKEKEIIVFDDCSTDNSIDILKNFEKLKIMINKKKQYKSSPLNQIYGIIELFKKSKGDIIFLLDGDDQFKRNKIQIVVNEFKKNKDLKFVQDKPYMTEKKRLMFLKKKSHLFSIWPSFYPTSCMAVKRSFFKKFLNYIEKKKFPNLEIDARIVMFAYLKNEFIVSDKSLTLYNYDEYGITSNYRKYSKNWWKKRSEAFEYLKMLNKKMNKVNKIGPDYYLTKFINFFI